jgi:hypothetical protein
LLGVQLLPHLVKPPAHWVVEQRLFWQTKLPQSPALQQLPSTHALPQFRRPSGQEPLQAWLRGMQALPQR